MTRRDLAGRRFGRLVVVRFEAPASYRGSMWLCRCDCGAEVVRRASNLERGTTASCGCFQRDGLRARSLRHGFAARGRMAPVYQVWRGMMARCFDETNPGFRNYGGRGITVCDRWRSIENFVADMGLRPSGLTLDRIDNDGNYEPGNCRWASRKEQNRNSRQARLNSEAVKVIRWARPRRLVTRVARIYGVHPTTALLVAEGRAWS